MEAAKEEAEEAEGLDFFVVSKKRVLCGIVTRYTRPRNTDGRTSLEQAAIAAPSHPTSTCTHTYPFTYSDIFTDTTQNIKIKITFEMITAIHRHNCPC